MSENNIKKSRMARFTHHYSGRRLRVCFGVLYVHKIIRRRNFECVFFLSKYSSE